MKTITVGIEGISPLLMHRYPLEPEEAIEKKPMEYQAEYAAYRDESGELYIPGVAIQRSLINAATYSKGTGRASLQKTAAACLMVEPEIVGLGAKDYTIDSRRVVVPATRGAVIRHRPRLDKWGCEFSLSWDDVLLSDVQVRKIVDDSGSRVGLLDFRPERKGPFGRYMVTGWDSD